MVLNKVVPIEVNGILFWGIGAGGVTKEEVGKISYPPDSVLHLIRHFVELPEEWINRAVLEAVADRSVIERELRMPGSKWNPGILRTPHEAIAFCQHLADELIERGEELKWICRGQLDFCYFSHLVTPDEKKRLLGCDPAMTMGTSGLIPTKDVPKGIRVIRVFNRGGEVNVVEMDMPATDRVTITLARKENGVIQVYSAFPGVLTPPIPRASQLPEEMEYNRIFWEQYALVRSRTEKEA